MKTFLGKRSVKEDILNYDTHRILTTPGGLYGGQSCGLPQLVGSLVELLCRTTNGVLVHAGLEVKLERLMASKGASFEKEVAYRASQAAGESMRNRQLPCLLLWPFAHEHVCSYTIAVAHKLKQLRYNQGIQSGIWESGKPMVGQGCCMGA